jgi:uncharacterized membrane protein
MMHDVVFSSYDHVEAAGFIFRTVKGIFVLVGSVIAAVLCAVIASFKGRNPLIWGLAGLFFSIITLIVVLIIPKKE